MDDLNRQIVRKSTLAEQGNDDDLSLYTVPDVFVELVAQHIRNEESYERRVVQGSLSGTSSEGIEFDQVLFSAVDLSKTKWQRIQLRKARLGKCDLANACWNAARIQFLQAGKCRGTGFQLLDANVSEALFRDCNFHLGAFHGSKFRDCRWDHCDLREANFEGAQLVDVVFRNCDLRAARFPNCHFQNFDLRGSKLTATQFDVGALRSVTVDPTQLLDLALVFGLRVESLDDAK